MALAKAGFISTSMYDNEDNAILLPEIQFDYAVLHFEDLHISKKVNKLLKRNDYTFTINTKFQEVMNKINGYHEISWLSLEYQQMLLDTKQAFHENFEVVSIELNNSDNELISAEIGYTIGTTYTSLTGFCNREKAYNNWGKLQLVLLSQYLQTKGFDFWNLGHASLQYKIDLGAKIYSREDFLILWKKAVNKKL